MECFHYRSQCDFQAKQTNNALRCALQPLKKPGTYPRTLKGTHKNLLAPGRHSARAPRLQITLWQWQQGWPRWITRGPELFSDRHAARENLKKKLRPSRINSLFRVPPVTESRSVGRGNFVSLSKSLYSTYKCMQHIYRYVYIAMYVDHSSYVRAHSCTYTLHVSMLIVCSRDRGPRWRGRY